MKFSHFHGPELSDEEREKRLSDFKKTVRRLNLTGLFKITQITDWQWRFEFDGYRFDMLPVSKKVIDVQTLQWFDGRWIAHLEMIERHCQSYLLSSSTNGPE